MDAPPAAYTSDPLLTAFRAARDQQQADTLLAQLLETEAAPVIARVLRGKAGRSDDAGRDSIADLTSAAREELISRLLDFRSDPASTEIRNFRGYVAAVAYNVWAEHLRREKPGRAMLLNRVRYLLENRTRQRGFALWDGPAGERWCGLQDMRNTALPLVTTPKLQLLCVDPSAVAREAFSGRDWRRIDMAELLSQLFRWLDAPVELRHLLDALAELLEISDERVSIDAQSRPLAEAEFVDPAVSAVDALKWMEYLRWLWAELAHLSMSQRTAFLLHSHVTREFDHRGVASLRQLAASLGLSAEEFATIWNELPQDDFKIAERLQLQRQQVINLRRVARDRLGGAWREWIK